MGELLDKYRSLQGLHGRLRALRRLLRQVPLLPRHRRPQEHAGGAAGPDARGLSPLLHLRRQAFPEAGRRGRHDQGRARRLVQLLQPVLGVPALLGVLPLRHRHRRDHDGRSRDHGLGGPGPKVLQRDHRQGAQDRQQPGHPRARAGRHAGRAGRGHQGGDRPRRSLPARCRGRRSAAGHAVGRLLRRAACRKPDRLRQGVPCRRHQLDAELQGL